MTINMFDLTGKVAIVTGIGHGLGQGMAIALAQAGADIAGVGISDCTETRRMIEATGREFLEMKADLRSIEPIPQIMEKVVNHFGHLDILVNNAGIIRRSDALEFSEKDWDDVSSVALK